MDLKRLRTFVAVADQGTVSKAAETLHITQPALSRQIGSLEEELGFALFERIGRRLRLTPQGEQLLEECRSLVAHAGSLSERARSLRRGDVSELRVAGSALTVEAMLADFLPHCRRRLPEVRIAPIEAEAGEHLAMLERGEAHLALGVVDILRIDEESFGMAMLPRFQLLAAFAPDAKIEANGAVEIRQLARHPLLLLDPGYATRGVFDATCRLAQVRPRVAFESGASHTLVALAEAGHGVAVIPSVLRIDRKRVRTARISHRRAPLELSPAVIWARRRLLPRHAERFAELFAEHLRESHPALRKGR